MNNVSPSFLMMGLGRSGTTLTQSIINAGTDMLLSRECWWLPDLCNGYDVYRKYFSPDDDKLWNEAVSCMHSKLFCNFTTKFGLQTIGYRNCMYAKRILGIFPAKVVHIVRDPRDTFTSTLRTGIHSSFSSFVKSYQCIRENSQFGYLLFKYEDMMNDPEEAIKELCDFIEIKFSTKMLEPLTRNISGCETPLLESIDRIDKRSQSVFGKWKRSFTGEDLIDVNCHFDLLHSLGYEVWQEDGAKINIYTSEDRLQYKTSGLTVLSEQKTNYGYQVCVGIKSIGSISIQFNSSVQIEKVELEKHGLFYKSETYQNLFIFNLANLTCQDIYGKNRYYTFHSLVKKLGLGEKNRVALYTAGGATQAFIQELFQKDLVSSINIEAIIDRQKQGWISTIPITKLEDADMTKFDHIIVTSLAYYGEIARTLEGLGLEHGKDFSGALFPNQETLNWF